MQNQIQIQSQLKHSYSIKAYLKINPARGIQPTATSLYEILDDNTLLDLQSTKKQTNKYQMLKLTYIFREQSTSQMIITSMNIIQEPFNGINQMIITNGNLFHKNGIIGSLQRPGILIYLLRTLFDQCKQTYQLNTRLFLSSYATEGASNKYIDLLLGQKFQFHTKKDIDIYQSFYEKQLSTYQELYIALKIVSQRFKQCCQSKDTVIFKFIIEHCEQNSKYKKYSVFHFVNCGQLNIYEQFIKATGQNINNIEQRYRFNENGNLIDYLQKQLRDSKIHFIYSLANNISELKDSFDTIIKLSNLINKSHTITQHKMPVSMQIHFKQLMSEKPKNPPIQLLNFQLYRKEVKLYENLKCNYEKFQSDNQYKLKKFCYILQEQIIIRQQFYEKQKQFILSEFKEGTMLQFYISKLFNLSQRFVIKSRSVQYQKLKRLKNQILLSWKSCQKDIEQEFQSVQLNKLMKQYQKQLKFIKNVLNFIFHLTSRIAISQSLHLIELNPWSIFQKNHHHRGQLPVDLNKHRNARLPQFSIRNVQINENQISEKNKKSFASKEIIKHKINKSNTLFEDYLKQQQQ